MHVLYQAAEFEVFEYPPVARTILVQTQRDYLTKRRGTEHHMVFPWIVFIRTSSTQELYNYFSYFHVFYLKEQFHSGRQEVYHSLDINSHGYGICLSHNHDEVIELKKMKLKSLIDCYWGSPCRTSDVVLFESNVLQAAQRVNFSTKSIASNAFETCLGLDKFEKFKKKHNKAFKK